MIILARRRKYSHTFAMFYQKFLQGGNFKFDMFETIFSTFQIYFGIRGFIRWPGVAYQIWKMKIQINVTLLLKRVDLKMNGF